MEQTENPDVLDDASLKKITDLMRGMRYGSVTIVVQDGKVVQIDRTEKYKVKN